jgi:hypothetical protein
LITKVFPNKLKNLNPKAFKNISFQHSKKEQKLFQKKPKNPSEKIYNHFQNSIPQICETSENTFQVFLDYSMENTFS